MPVARIVLVASVLGFCAFAPAAFAQKQQPKTVDPFDDPDPLDAADAPTTPVKPDSVLVDPFGPGGSNVKPPPQPTAPFGEHPDLQKGQLVNPYRKPLAGGMPIDPYAPPVQTQAQPIALPPMPPAPPPIPPDYNPLVPQVPSGAGIPPQSLTHKKGNQRFVRFALGFAYRRALGTDLYAANPEIVVGVSDEHWAGGGHFDLLAGQLASGLSFQWMHVGPTFYYQPVHGFHIGAGTSIGWITIQRFTRESDPLWSLSFGVHLSLDVDLTHDADHGGIFLQGKVGYDVLTQTTALSVNALLAGVSLGYRFQ